MSNRHSFGEPKEIDVRQLYKIWDLEKEISGRDDTKEKLAIAYRNRDFEINKFWGLFKCYSAILVTCFAGFTYYIQDGIENINIYLLLSLLFFTAFICAVLRLSLLSTRSWQKHWERMIDFLEEYGSCTLYAINYTKKEAGGAARHTIQLVNFTTSLFSAGFLFFVLFSIGKPINLVIAILISFLFLVIFFNIINEKADGKDASLTIRYNPDCVYKSSSHKKIEIRNTILKN